MDLYDFRRNLLQKDAKSYTIVLFVCYVFNRQSIFERKSYYELSEQENRRRPERYR